MRNIKTLIKKLKREAKEESQSWAALARDTMALRELDSILPGALKDDAPVPPKHVKDYATIRFIAIIQSAVRDGIREIVDHKEKMGRKLPNVPEKTQITFDMVRDFKSSCYSMGAFYSILLAYSSYEQIDSAFKNVAGVTFEHILNLGVIVDKDNMVRKMVKSGIVRMFERRNALCHEAISTQTEVTAEEIYQWYWITSHVVIDIKRYLYDTHVIKRTRRASDSGSRQ